MTQESEDEQKMSVYDKRCLKVVPVWTSLSDWLHAVVRCVDNGMHQLILFSVWSHFSLFGKKSSGMFFFYFFLSRYCLNNSFQSLHNDDFSCALTVYEYVWMTLAHVQGHRRINSCSGKLHFSTLKMSQQHLLLYLHIYILWQNLSPTKLLTQ